MITLASPDRSSTMIQFQCCCPNCRQLIQVKTHHAHKSVTCPRCETMFTAQNKPAVARQQDDAPTTKVRSTRWLFALFALVLTGSAVAFTIHWYQQPQPSLASIDKAIKPVDRPQDSSVTDGVADEEIKESLVLELGDDSFTIPEPPSPDLSELIALQPVVPGIPIAKPDIIKLEPLKAEQRPQPAEEQLPTTIQPFGDLKWDDDLLTASQKTLALTDSKSVTVSLERAVNERSLLSALRRQLTTRRGTVLGIDKPVAYRDRGWLHIEGYPVIISQGAFEISLSFICEPGYVLDHADECLSHARQILGPEADCYLPLRLQRVRLALQEDTKSRTLDIDTRKEIAIRIYNQLKTNYVSKEHFTSTESTYEATWQDRSENKLLLRANPGRVELVYERDPSDLIALNKKLRELQDKIKEKDHQDRFAKSEDRSNNL